MKRNLTNVIIWGIVSLLWIGLAVWRLVDHEAGLLIGMTVGVAFLSSVCFVLNLLRYIKDGRAASKGAAAPTESKDDTASL